MAAAETGFHSVHLDDYDREQRFAPRRDLCVVPAATETLRLAIGARVPAGAVSVTGYDATGSAGSMKEQLSRAEKCRRGTSVLVTAPTFTAGLVIYRGEVVTYAPILRRWVRGWSAWEALDRLRAQGWRVEILSGQAVAP